MKKAMLLVAFLVIAMSVSLSAVAEANMLSNPGFESPIGNGTDPDAWWGLRQYPSSTDVEMKNSTFESYAGSQSGRITMSANTGSDQNLWAGYGQQLDIAAGDPILASAWIKCTDANGTQAKLQLEFKDIMGAEVNRTFATAPVNQAFDWTQLEVSDITAPAGTASVLVNLLVEKGSGAAYGEYYWDEASLDVVPEPSSLMLLFSGLAGLFGIGRRKR